MKGYNTARPQISVIVPFYNTEQYLERCIEHLIAQSMHKEIILIDDGSTDHSYKIASRYAAMNSCVVILRQNNQGQSAARNRGLEAATGEYVLFCDSDDFIEEESLPELYEICKNNRLDFLKTGWITEMERGQQKNIPPVKRITQNQVITAWQYFSQSIGYWYNVVPWNGIFCLDFLRRNALTFPEGIQFEDNTFHLKAMLCQLDARMMQIEFPFYHVCVRPQSTTTEKSSPQKIYDQLQNVALMEEFVGQSDLTKQCKAQARRAVSSLVFTMTSYYYRTDYRYRAELRNAIPKSILRRAVRHPQTAFQCSKILAFLYVRPLLDGYQAIKLKRQKKH